MKWKWHRGPYFFFYISAGSGVSGRPLLLAGVGRHTHVGPLSLYIVRRPFLLLRNPKSFLITKKKKTIPPQKRRMNKNRKKNTNVQTPTKQVDKKPTLFPGCDRDSRTTATATAAMTCMICKPSAVGVSGPMHCMYSNLKSTRRRRHASISFFFFCAYFFFSRPLPLYPLTGGS